MTDAEIAHAAEVLRGGGLVAFPTETVYGLGADAANPNALRRLYEVKRRPADHPVIVHIARSSQLDDLAIEIPPIARTLAGAFWPGPLTLVVRRRPGAVADEATGGRETVGVRVPAHPIALELLDAFGAGIAAPSANRFGRVSPTTAAHVRADLNGDVDVIIDGGPCVVGLESTIVDVTGNEPAILRVGGLGEERLADVASRRLPRRTEGEVAAPGTLASHYAPNARVEVMAYDEIAAHAERLRARGLRVVVLDAPAQPDDYARALYRLLRDADAPDVDVIVAPLPADDTGLAAAVRDRLRRASAG